MALRVSIALLWLSFVVCDSARLYHTAHASHSNAALSSIRQFQTGRPCALYPALQKKFGSPVTLGGYETVRCLGRGEQGEAWLIKGMDAVLKVLYEVDEQAARTSEHACTFAKHMHKRDPEHFVNCWKTGIVELDMKTDDPVLDGTKTKKNDCNLCPWDHQNLLSKTTAGFDENRNASYTCMEAQTFATTQGAAAVGGCMGARALWGWTCCSVSGDYRYPGIPNVRLHYSVDGLAAGDEVRDLMIPGVSEMFPKLQDGLRMLHEILVIADRMMKPTLEDPSQFYYLDLHLGNVMVTSDKKLKFIDYGATYMCCNHSYPGAAAKCGDLPECDPAEERKFESLTNTFLFFDLLEVIMGTGFEMLWQPGFSDILDYFTLPWAMHGLLDPQRKAVERLTPAMTVAKNLPPVKESYRADWQRLGGIATDMIHAGMKELVDRVPTWPAPMIHFLERAMDRLS